MPGFLLLFPFFLARFGLLSLLNKGAVRRAAYFPPLAGKERTAYWLYQLSNLAIIVCLFFVKLKTAPPLLFYGGLFLYCAGMLLLIVSIVNFSAPTQNGINTQGLYKLSRNPMYLAYFVYYLGCAALTQSLPLLAFTLIFQISAHWIILSEERWCIEQFGEEYRAYMNRVRRYI